MSLKDHCQLRHFISAVLLVFFYAASTSAQISSATGFKVLAIAERGGTHQPFVDAAKLWLQKEATADNFTIDYIEDSRPIDAAYLAHY